ncbi:MAG: FkbM family methyltransferase [Bacteroidota bacterium]
MGKIKQLLYKLLPEWLYLRILHRAFYFLYDLGFLKNDKRFKYHYAVKKWIQPDFVVVDIGANLGYFSKTFLRKAKNGKVISIEPIPQFYTILERFLKKFPNSIRYNVALGKEEGSITMVLPKSNGMIRTGLPHIAEDEAEKKANATQEVKIVRGSELLSNLDRLDYIKCDIEGYELNVFEELKPILEKYQPIVQIEIAEKNQKAMLALFQSLGYTQFGIKDFKLIAENGAQAEEGDYIFVPKGKKLPN